MRSHWIYLLILQVLIWKHPSFINSGQPDAECQGVFAQHAGAISAVSIIIHAGRSKTPSMAANSKHAWYSPSSRWIDRCGYGLNLDRGRRSNVKCRVIICLLTAVIVAFLIPVSSVCSALLFVHVGDGLYLCSRLAYLYWFCEIFDCGLQMCSGQSACWDCDLKAGINDELMTSYLSFSLQCYCASCMLVAFVFAFSGFRSCWFGVLL